MKIITTPKQLLNEVCNCFNVFPEQINVLKKSNEKVKIRHYYAYVGVKYYGFKLAALGSELVGAKSNKRKDHTTIIHSKNKIKELLDVLDPVCYNDIEHLKNYLDLNSRNVCTEGLLEENTKVVGELLEYKRLNRQLQQRIDKLLNTIKEKDKLIDRISPKGIFGQRIIITPNT